MLAAPVALYDVADTEAFVQATINRARLILSIDERDELVCEGMALMAKLADDYRPHIDGHATEGRFSGYAAMYLPRKLGDAWHRLHEEHQLVTDNETGKRRWHYRERSVSLEALTAEDPDRHSLMASAPASSDLATRLRGALWERAEREIEMTVQVGELLGEGATPSDVATMLGLQPGQVRDYMGAIGKVAHRLQSEAA